MTDYLQQLQLNVIFKGLDTVTTKAECANFVLELRRRLKLDHDTTIEELLTLGLHAKQTKSAQAPPSPPSTTTPKSDALTASDVLRNRAPYKPLIKKILSSNWDFCDHRPRRVPMEKTPDEVKEYLEKLDQNGCPDDDLIRDLSLTERQHNLLKMILESYTHWEANPNPSQSPDPGTLRRPKPLTTSLQQLRANLLATLAKN
jgi:hypothetical protein